MVPEQTSQEILDLFRKHGHLEYGEGITQLSHAVQAGLIAREKGLEAELVLAAFLHDIGHLCPLESAHTEFRMMGNFGIEAHDHCGEVFLKERGFSDRIAAVVKNHVAAKRYLCYANPAYYDSLSVASKETLRYQGGPMQEEEARIFEADPFFEESVLLRHIDEEAKKTNFEVTEAHSAFFGKLMREYLSTDGHK